LASKRKYRVAVVGAAGTWGRKYLRAYVNHQDCDVVALVDRARDRREEFARHYGVETVYDSVEDLLAHDVPDVVSIILPVAESPAAVIACAEAGVKAISCEKPIAVELAQADEMVRICRERGIPLGCGTACWEAPHFLETVQWIRAGNIGRLTAAAIPTGIRQEVSGGACPQFVMLRRLTGMEVEWVEGESLPPVPLPGGVAPPGASELETDCGVFGRLGLSGGVICEIPRRDGKEKVNCRVAVTGEEGEVRIAGPCPVLIKGVGAASSPVRPQFLDAPCELFFGPVIDHLIRALETGAETPCSGHDYRQALEIAVAMKLSAQRNHQRVYLPLEDRSGKIFPIPYRLQGGDVAGWAGGNYQGPPQVEPLNATWRYPGNKS